MIVYCQFNTSAYPSVFYQVQRAPPKWRFRTQEREPYKLLREGVKTKGAWVLSGFTVWLLNLSNTRSCFSVAAGKEFLTGFLGSLVARKEETQNRAWQMKSAEFSLTSKSLFGKFANHQN